MELNLLFSGYFVLSAVFLILWIKNISSVSKAVKALSDADKLQALGACKSPEERRSFCAGCKISENNIFFRAVSEIALNKYDGSTPDIQMLYDRLKTEAEKPSVLLFRLTYSMLFISVLLLAFGYMQGVSRVYCCAAVFVAINLFKLKSDSILNRASCCITDMCVPVLCPIGKTRFSRRMSALDSVIKQLEQETKSMRLSADNTGQSKKSAEAAEKHLSQISSLLNELYKISEEESKKSPFTVLSAINDSIDSFNAAVSAAQNSYNDNFNSYKSVLNNMSDIAQIEKNVKKLSDKTVKSVEEFSDTYTGIAKEIHDILNDGLDKLIEDSRFSFTNLNTMSEEIYEQIKNIFEQHVASANDMCRISESGFSDIQKQLNDYCKLSADRLNEIVRINKNTEKGIMALCSVNCRLIEAIEKDGGSANAAAKQLIKTGGAENLSEYFMSLSVNMEKAAEYLEKLTGKADEKGAEPIS